MMMLYTKDGRKWTNAILIGIADAFRGHMDNEHIGEEYAVHTDFGNVRYMTIEQIQRDYILGPPRDYKEWIEARNNPEIPALQGNLPRNIPQGGAPL